MEGVEVESRVLRYLEEHNAPVAWDAFYADALEWGIEPRAFTKALRDLLVAGRVDQIARHYVDDGARRLVILLTTRDVAESFSRGRVPAAASSVRYLWD